MRFSDNGPGEDTLLVEAGVAGAGVAARVDADAGDGAAAAAPAVAFFSSDLERGTFPGAFCATPAAFFPGGGLGRGH